MDITFERITGIASLYYPAYVLRYITDFPKAERREIKEILQLLDRTNSPFNLEAIIHEGLFVGFISYWKLPSFIFFEHFSIAPQVRSKGIGGLVMNAIKLRYPEEKFILEIEPPIDDISMRRYKFYEKSGFTISDLPYRQPPYRNNEDPMPLRLMAMRFNSPISDSEVNELRELVYGIKN